VLTACHVTTALQAIVSRNIRPSDTAVLSVTTIQAGEAYNVIPQTAVIRGTFRTFSNDTMKQIEDGMRRTATGVAAAFGATAKVEFPDVWAQLVNDPAETQFIADVAADLVGEEHVDRNRSLIMGSEDFAYMLEACPGAFINIGIGDTDGPFHRSRLQRAGQLRRAAQARPGHAVRVGIRDSGVSQPPRRATVSLLPRVAALVPARGAG
jgi:hippurate hydrolase